MQLGGVLEHAACLPHAFIDHVHGLLLAGAGILDDGREVLELPAQHFVHALDEAAGHFIDEAQLLLRIDVHKFLEALLDGHGGAGDDFLKAVGEAALRSCAMVWMRAVCSCW